MRQGNSWRLLASSRTGRRASLAAGKIGDARAPGVGKNEAGGERVARIEGDLRHAVNPGAAGDARTCDAASAVFDGSDLYAEFAADDGVGEQRVARFLFAARDQGRNAGRAA